MVDQTRAAACLKEIEEVLAKHNFNLVPTIQLFEAPVTEGEPVEKPEEEVAPTEVEGEVVG